MGKDHYTNVHIAISCRTTT